MVDLPHTSCTIKIEELLFFQRRTEELWQSTDNGNVHRPKDDASIFMTSGLNG
jgi:hypothetical protein